jgi:hypothetical protein
MSLTLTLSSSFVVVVVVVADADESAQLANSCMLGFQRLDV